MSPKTFGGNKIYNKFFHSGGQSFIFSEEISMVLDAVLRRRLSCKSDKSLVKILRSFAVLEVDF